MGAHLHLTRGPDARDAIDALASACGGRVGLAGVLDDLDRVAEPASAPRTAVASAFRWDRADSRSARWWPQGITTSADACADETYAGRRVVVTTAYAKKVGGVAQGARISVVDVTDADRPRYRHVLLVEAVLDQDGTVDLRPVHVHAGGAVWRGRHLHVAATARGLVSFDVEDVVAVGGEDRPEVLGRQPDGSVAGFGYRYVLPVRWVHRAGAVGTAGLRYSFVSLSHGGRAELVAGEYGRGDMTTRLVRFPVDDAGLPAGDDAGALAPRFLDVGGTSRMQGAVEAHGRLYVTTSDGPRRRGSLWTGTTLLVRHARVLPVGPEDIAYWPSTDRLWTLTEYPGRRLVVTLDRARFD